MSQKFSFIIIVEPNGSLSSKAFKKENAQDALNEFAKLRDQGKEAHFYHFPKADKRCKSAKAIEELNGYTGGSVEKEEVVEEQKPAKRGKKPSEPTATDLE